MRETEDVMLVPFIVLRHRLLNETRKRSDHCKEHATNLACRIPRLLSVAGYTHAYRLGLRPPLEGTQPQTVYSFALDTVYTSNVVSSSSRIKRHLTPKEQKLCLPSIPPPLPQTPKVKRDFSLLLCHSLYHPLDRLLRKQDPFLPTVPGT